MADMEDDMNATRSERRASARSPWARQVVVGDPADQPTPLSPPAAVGAPTEPTGYRVSRGLQAEVVFPADETAFDERDTERPPRMEVV